MLTYASVQQKKKGSHHGRCVGPCQLSERSCMIQFDHLSTESSETVYSQNLSVKICRNYNMKLYAEKYLYEANKGEALTFPTTVANGGNTGVLTNVNVDVFAPMAEKLRFHRKRLRASSPERRVSSPSGLFPRQTLSPANTRLRLRSPPTRPRRTMSSISSSRNSQWLPCSGYLCSGSLAVGCITCSGSISGDKRR
jgi:hypothetical protein